jgi:predicted lipid-binding transport protein (Tim44 family)
MQAIGGFPVDLVLFAMIAAFLVLRLRSILGKRTGFEGTPVAAPAPTAGTGPVTDGKAEPPPPPARPLPAAASAAGQALAAMQAADRRFESAKFIAGAEAAFRVIVGAFAAGDRVRLRPLLGDATYAAFDHAIAAREAAGETQHTEIRDILDAEIHEAHLDGKQASIVVHFVSRQINYTTASDGSTVAGTDAMTEIADLWTFARILDSSDPSWHLVDAKVA